MKNLGLGAARVVSFLVVVVLGAGCAATNQPTDLSSPATPLEALRAHLAAKHRAVKQVDLKLAEVPRTLEIAHLGPDGRDDFSAWCRARGGSVGSTATKARNDVYLAESIYRTTVPGWVYQLVKESCTVGELTSVQLVVAGNTGSAVYRRAAWVAPEEITAYGAVADAKAQEVRRKELAKQEAETKRREAEIADADARIKRREAEVLAYLKNSPKGTQQSCSARQGPDRGIHELVFDCGPRLIAYSQFGEHGWRIGSQSVTPEVTPLGREAFRVDLLIEKVR